MKKILFLILLFISNNLYSQDPNDCVNSIVICGNSTLNLDVNGFGFQEVTGNSGCGSGEHTSVWFKLNVAVSGTLGFVLTPNSTSINEDYDFFIFGPNVACDEFVSTIRCSTTNPSAANSASNLTGMNSSETDTFEGPGPDGNNFVQELTVTAGEFYYLCIDRPVGNSPFSLEWTGTASFNEAPTGFDSLLEGCANPGEYTYTFNLQENEVNLINGQDVTVSYYSTISDAQIGVNAITDPATFNSTNGIVFVRMVDNITECFSVYEIELVVFLLETSSSNVLTICDDSGFASFDFSNQNTYLIGNNTSTIVSYYENFNDANLISNEIESGYTNISNPQTIWYRLDKTDDGCFYIGTFEITVDTFFTNPEPNFVDNQTSNYCLNSINQTIDLGPQFDNNNNDDFTYLWSTGATTTTLNIDTDGDYSVVISTVNGCAKQQNYHVASIQIQTPESLYLCDFDGVATFSFLNQSAILLAGNADVEIAYYGSGLDAFLEVNPIGETYTNTTLTEVISYRINKTNEACFYIGSFDINVILFFENPEPNYVDEENIIYCLDSYPNTIDLNVNFENNDIADYTFLWSTGESGASIAINEAGEYSVEITNPFDCKQTKKFYVEESVVFENDEPAFVDEVIYYCTNTYPTNIELNTNIEQNDLVNYTFLWSTLETTPTININEIGDYTIEVYNDDLCVDSRTITVLPSSIPIIDHVVFADTTNPERVSILIVVIGSGNYVYAIDLDLLQVDDATYFQSENTFVGLLYGSHTVTVKDLNGCGMVHKEIHILSYPKFFTPNDDGHYDTWNLNNINAICNEYHTISMLTIYDRYGKAVAKIDPKGLGWNGKYKQQLMTEADYWFTVELLNYKGKRIFKKGHFSLKNN
ncbi:MAG: T9SS type B sorting domain-containing protein [Flavobacteriaceae bacterium]